VNLKVTHTDAKRGVPFSSDLCRTDSLRTHLGNEISFQHNFAVVPYCTIENAFLSLWQSKGKILEIQSFGTTRGAPVVTLPQPKSPEKELLPNTRAKKLN
jgi:hypothetical protein